jgi:hypothetical protein
MSVILNASTSKVLSATLPGGSFSIENGVRLEIIRVKYVTAATFAIVAELGDGSALIQNLNLDATGTEGYCTPDGFTTEWSAVITPAPTTGVWILQGCAMEGNANGVSKTVKQYRDADTATGTNTGTADTGDMLNAALGHGTFPPDVKLCEYGYFTVADIAAADAVVAALRSGPGDGRYLNGIGSVATPDFYWRLFSDVNATIGGVNLSNAGGASFDGDNPTLSYEPAYTQAAFRFRNDNGALTELA